MSRRLLLCALSLLGLSSQLVACQEDADERQLALALACTNMRGRSKSNFIGTFRATSATWHLKLQRPGWADEPPDDERVFRFGARDSVPVVGDWDGDGSQTPGTWQAGRWLLSNALGSSTLDATFMFGEPGDTPIVGDWDGDGRASPGVYRAGVFSLRNDLADGPPDFTVALGEAGDQPIAGDWDADGRDGVGIYRARDGTFTLLDQLQGDAPTATYFFAEAERSSLPVVGDWDDDGSSTIGLRSGDRWHLRNDNARAWGALTVRYGEPSDIPVVGNWRLDACRGFPPTPDSLRAFFPLAVDYQSPQDFAKWKARGINTVMRVPRGEDVDAWTAEANRLELKMIRAPRSDPSDDNQETNLLAFAIKDEPEVDVLFLRTDPYPALARVVEELRAPGIVQRPVLINFAGTFMLDPTDPLHGPGDDGPDWYTAYVRLQDWVSQDIYPLGQLRARFGMNEADAMASLPLAMDKLRRWAPDKPQFAYVEASQSDARANAPPLLPGPFRAQIWSAILRGARGIFYFPHGGCELACGPRDVMTPDLVEQMIQQNARITRLASVLQTAVDPPLFSVTAALPLRVGWREQHGKKYIVAVNYGAAAVERWLRIDGRPVHGTIEVLDEARTIGPLHAMSFRDHFEPYEVHIYRFE